LCEFFPRFSSPLAANGYFNTFYAKTKIISELKIVDRKKNHSQKKFLAGQQLLPM
jgi:hypothetical protein